MQPNSALRKTMTVSAVGDSALSTSARPSAAQTQIAPSFCRQVTLVGEISERYELIQPLAVEFEAGDDGGHVTSDNVFFMYGVGETRRAALEDYVSSLCEYYELLAEQTDAPTVALFKFLQTYLRPTGN